jgi:hypothetical protein
VGTDAAKPCTVTVQQNAAPVAGIVGISKAVSGQVMSFAFTATDSVADALAGFSFTVNWGDGKSETFQGGSGVTRTHYYASQGQYTITATATDQHQAKSAPVSQGISIFNYMVVGSRVFIGGTKGADSITISTASVKGNTGDRIVAILNNKVLPTPNATLKPSEIVIYGSDGNDIITAVSAKVPVTSKTTKTVFPNVPLVIFGGAGNDIISVKASRAGSVVVGGIGSDTITGSAIARDILIGGAGGDVLSGGDGTDDVMIGGSTIYDDSVVSLDHLLSAWNSTASYSSRTQTLFTGSAATGNARLNSSTIRDDAADALFGGSGDHDWFLASTAGAKKDTLDRVTSGAGKESLVTI